MRILEKLSSQAITLSDFRSDMLSLRVSEYLDTKDVACDMCLLMFFLRKFLCLGNPLMCLAHKAAKLKCDQQVNANGK